MRFSHFLSCLVTPFLALASGGYTQASLVLNGDFESGNSGFTSGYLYNASTIATPGGYSIVTDPSAVHPGAASYGDHTTGTGSMLAANGGFIPRLLVWGESVAVLPDSLYRFAAYVSSWTDSSPANLLFSINGETIGSLQAPATTGIWQGFSATWNSGSATTAAIEIMNNNLDPNGNDFALDDIYFGESLFTNPTPTVSWLLTAGLIALACVRARRRQDGTKFHGQEAQLGDRIPLKSPHGRPEGTGAFEDSGGTRDRLVVTDGDRQCSAPSNWRHAFP